MRRSFRARQWFRRQLDCLCWLFVSCLPYCDVNDKICNFSCEGWSTLNNADCVILSRRVLNVNECRWSCEWFPRGPTDFLPLLDLELFFHSFPFILFFWLYILDPHLEKICESRSTNPNINPKVEVATQFKAVGSIFTLLSPQTCIVLWQQKTPVISTLRFI